jgi:hypothetical protein
MFAERLENFQYFYVAYSWKKKPYVKFQIRKTNDKIEATLINL